MAVSGKGVPMLRWLLQPFGLPLFCLLNFLFASYVFYLNRWPCHLLHSQFTSLRKGLIHLTNRLDAHNVPYILYEGTLLGFVRDKDIIAWDSDVDIALVSPMDERFDAAMKDPLLLEHLVPQTGIGCWKIYTRDRYNQSDLWRIFYKRPYIDICLLSAIGQANEFEVTQGGNRSQISVWGHQFYAPGDIHRALSFMYGPNYMTPDPTDDRGAGFNSFSTSCPYFARRFIWLSAFFALVFALLACKWLPLTQTVPWRIFTLWSALGTLILGLLSLFFLITETGHAAGIYA